MRATYSLASPSLEGLLTHADLAYDGIRRPMEVLQAFDKPPAGAPRKACGPRESKLLERYFYDLYGVFMKKLSGFVLASDASEAEAMKLQALLQEMIKTKRLMAS